MNPVLEKLKLYGLLPAAGGVVGAWLAVMIIWVVVHVIAQPCQRVVVLFGMVEYVKDGDCQAIPSAPEPTGELSLNCPQSVEANEAPVHGLVGVGASEVTIYSGPWCGELLMWKQASAQTHPDGSWDFNVRLGNPFGIDHECPFPRYGVYVVAGTPPTAAKDPITKDALESALKGRQWRSCEIDRKQERELACRSKRRRITRPAPSSCPFAFGHLVDPTCDPARPVEVKEEPVSFEWAPVQKMRVELYRGGEPWNGFPKWAESGMTEQLPAGLYEFKISESERDECVRSVWFRTLADSARPGSVTVPDAPTPEGLAASETVVNSGHDGTPTKGEIMQLARTLGLTSPKRPNQHLAFFEGDASYWERQKLSLTEVARQLRARKHILDKASDDDRRIRSPGELSHDASEWLGWQ